VEEVKKGEKREREREGNIFCESAQTAFDCLVGELNEKKTILASLSTLNPSVIKML